MSVRTPMRIGPEPAPRAARQQRGVSEGPDRAGPERADSCRDDLATTTAELGHVILSQLP